MPNGLLRPILLATLIAGTLDICAAIILSLTLGHGPANMLRFVASGPFPSATEWGSAGAALGLVTHFVLLRAPLTTDFGSWRGTHALIFLLTVGVLGLGSCAIAAGRLVRRSSPERYFLPHR